MESSASLEKRARALRENRPRRPLPAWLDGALHRALWPGISAIALAALVAPAQGAGGSGVADPRAMTRNPPADVQASVIGGPIVSPLDGHTYYLLGPSDWSRSEAEARALGGHLASIGSEAENAWIASTFGFFGGVPRALWIGLNDAAVEGAFVWSDGTPIVFTNWGPAEPNDHLGLEDWAHLFPPTDGRHPAWNDAPDVPDAFGFVFNGVAEIPAVPEPPASVLMVAALTGLWTVVGRRRRRSDGRA